MLGWINACRNFYSEGSKEKKCRQKFFDSTHILGCGTPLVILFDISRQFLKATFWNFWPKYWSYTKILFCKVVDLAKIMGLSRTLFLSKTNSLACNFRKCRENWTLEPKSITKGVSQAKLWVVSKICCLHFFTLDPSEKKLRQAFFHQNNILEVISCFRPLGHAKRKFWLFFPKNHYFLQK